MRRRRRLFRQRGGRRVLRVGHAEMLGGVLVGPSLRISTTWLPKTRAAGARNGRLRVRFRSGALDTARARVGWRRRRIHRGQLAGRSDTVEMSLAAAAPAALLTRIGGCRGRCLVWSASTLLRGGRCRAGFGWVALTLYGIFFHGPVSACGMPFSKVDENGLLESRGNASISKQELWKGEYWLALEQLDQLWLRSSSFHNDVLW
jgi:hypothetical protein